jgi:hypothetical protein
VTLRFSATNAIRDLIGNALAASSLAETASTTWACAADSYGATCRCHIPTAPLTTDFPARLRVKSQTHPGGSAFAADKLRLVFTESLKYSGARPAFGTACAAFEGKWSAVDVEGTGDPSNVDSCVRVWTAEASFGDMYSAGAAAPLACGLVRSDADPASIVFHADFGVDNSVALPGGALRSMRHPLPFELVFPRLVALQAAQVTGYSALLTVAAITEQSAVRQASLNSARLRLRLLTSLQAPFALKASAPAPTVTAPSGLTLLSVALEGAECGPATQGLCTNTWLIEVEDVGGARCNFGGEYSVQFGAACRQGDVDCPLQDGGRTQTVTFSVSSSDHCPQLAETIGLSLSIASFEDAALSVPKRDFVEGQTMHFRVLFSAPQATLASSTIARLSAVRSCDGTSVALFENGAATSQGSAVSVATTGGVTSAAFSFVASSTLACVEAAAGRGGGGTRDLPVPAERRTTRRVGAA